MNHISKSLVTTALTAVLGLSTRTACGDTGLADGIEFEQSGEFDKAYAAWLSNRTYDAIEDALIRLQGTSIKTKGHD